MSKHRPAKTYVYTQKNARSIDLTMLLQHLYVYIICIFQTLPFVIFFYWVVIMGAAAEVAISIAKEYRCNNNRIKMSGNIWCMHT